MTFSPQVGKDKTLRVKIVKIHPLETPEGEAAEKKLEGTCDSPSSDKENASQEVHSKVPSSREEMRREIPSEWYLMSKRTTLDATRVTVT